MFHNFTSDQQFTSWIFESVISNDNDTFSKSTQNSLPWVLPDKYITDQLTIQLILSLLTLFSLFLPSTNKSL